MLNHWRLLPTLLILLSLLAGLLASGDTVSTGAEDRAKGNETFLKAFNILKSLSPREPKQTEITIDEFLTAAAEAQADEQHTNVANKIVKLFLKYAQSKLWGTLSSLLQWESLGFDDISSGFAKDMLDVASLNFPTDADGLPQVYETDSKALKKVKALKMLEVAGYKYENEDSVYLLAEILLYGKFACRRNVSAAFTHYNHLSHQFANATAQRMVGLMYASALGVERSYAKALLYMSFAAVSGDIIATQTLAYWNAAGIGMTKNCEDAAFYYGRVAQKVYEKFISGPPLGLSLPWPSKIRWADDEGGIYGPGASGSGNPSLMQPSSSGAVSPEDIIQYFELNAERGSIEYQFKLGVLYYTGDRHTPKDFRRAFLFFQEAVKGYPTEKMRTGGDKITQKDKEDALYASKAAAFMGMMYWRGEGVEKDATLARKFFEQGVKWEDAASKNALGVMYLMGDADLPKDAQKAKQYFIDAAKDSDMDAYINLGNLYFEHAKSAKDYEEAFKRFNAIASIISRKAPLVALIRLGEMYAKGLGTKQACTTGVQYYQAAAEKGDWHMPWIREAQAMFAARDYEGALIKYILAAEVGFEIAQTNAAWIIDTGLIDVEKTKIFKSQDPYEVALNLWNRAAIQGNVDARVKMGDYHFQGLGISNGSQVHSESGWSDMLRALVQPFSLTSSFKKLGLQPNFEKAALYYQVAAESQHSAIALWNLGYMHEMGVGVNKDFHLAKRLYDQALSTNPEAYLPVYISLGKLYIKFFWSWLTEGRIWAGLLGTEKKERGHDLPLFPKQEAPPSQGFWSFFKIVDIDTIMILVLGALAAGLVYYRQNI